MRAKCLQSFVLSRQARSKAWEMLLNGVGIIAVLNGGQSGGRVVQMNRKGFTLIELLIVVVIIGILAAIAIPKFANTKEKAYIASMKSDLRNLVTAEGAYFAASEKHSSTIGAGGRIFTQSTCNTAPAVNTTPDVWTANITNVNTTNTY